MKEFNQQEFNEFIIANGVVGFFDEPITFKSGRVGHYYVNWRDVVEDAYLTEKLADFVLEFVRDNNIDVETFYGVPEGATKLGIITQFKFAKSQPNFSKSSHVLSMGRAKPKDHGMPKDKFFVGAPNGKVVVIEDVTTTGGSLIETLTKLDSMGVDVVAVISLTNRMEMTKEGKSVKEAVENLGFNFYNMSSVLDVLPMAYEKFQPAENIIDSIKEYYDKYGIKSEVKFNMADELLAKIDEKQNPCVVGLDPLIEKIPEHLVRGDSFDDVANAFREFNFSIIDNIYDLVPAVKIQMAFYEKYGASGVQAFKDSVDYARSKGLIVIEDGKRNDISTTAQAYADGHLGVVKTKLSSSPSLDVDILTINPYLGSDGIMPFVDVCEKHRKGTFVLVKTSNLSSGEIQDRLVETTEDERLSLEKLGIEATDKVPLYNLVGLKINEIAQKYRGVGGYSHVGVVVGATYPNQAKILRKIIPNSFFLVPGYGAQGGTAGDVVPCFNDDGYGAVVNSSRGIIYAYKKYGNPEDFAKASREATKLMIRDIVIALEKGNKLPLKWKTI